MKRYLAILFVIAISGCSATTSPGSEAVSASDAALEMQSEEERSSEAHSELTQTTSSATRASEATENLKPASPETETEMESGTAESRKAENKGNLDKAANGQKSSDAISPKETGANAASTVPTISPPKPAPKPTPEIEIDETVCGAGGQEAYFETRRQEIYICRNENAALTYIATPKKQGNSVFLPATSIPDGDRTAYMAQDGTSVVVVGPFGYRREEKGKAITKERVIRNR